MNSIFFQPTTLRVKISVIKSNQTIKPLIKTIDQDEHQQQPVIKKELTWFSY